MMDLEDPVPLATPPKKQLGIKHVHWVCRQPPLPMLAAD
jgi:hypothetical protein